MKYYNDRAVSLNSYKIDSFKICIPPDKWKLTDKAIEQNQFGYSEEVSRTNKLTGETETEDNYVKANYRRWAEDKTKASFQYSIQEHGLIGIEPNSLYIKMNSKMLKGSYLHGITPETWTILYKNLIQEGFVDIDPNDFLDARIYDVDICIDHIVKNPRKLFKVARAMAQPNKQITTFNEATNLGIQFGHRDVGRSFKTKPYLKYYAKTIELLNNSEDFYNQHLKPVLSIGANTIFEELQVGLPENLVRAELTVKNSKAWASWGFQRPIKTLRDVLSITQAEFRELNKGYVKCYLQPRTIVKNLDELSAGRTWIASALERVAKERGYKDLDRYHRAARYEAERQYGNDSKYRGKKKQMLDMAIPIADFLIKEQNVGDQLTLEIQAEGKMFGLLP